MKKVLVTGASGAVGVHVIKYLLSEGKYEITALDLRNKRSSTRLRKYRKRINILYADVCDRVLMEALVKGHDIIIHLASAMPPLADMKKGLSLLIDYNGCENIVRAINYYNPECHLLFASSTSVYGKNDEVTERSKIDIDNLGYYSKEKLKCERLIKEKLKNYTIYRLPLVLGDMKEDPFMYHIKKNSVVDYITKEDAAYSFVRGIKYLDKINKKTYNVTAGEEITYKELLSKILSIYGISMKYVLSKLFLEKNYYSPVCKDSDLLDNLISYRNDSLNDYLNRLKRKSKKRTFNRTIAKLFGRI